MNVRAALEFGAAVLVLAGVGMVPAPAGAQECVPGAERSPTPTFRATLETPPDLSVWGFRFRWRWVNSGDFRNDCCLVNLKCEVIPNEDAGGIYMTCPGVDWSIPLQRYTNAQYPDELEVCVQTLYEDGSESPVCVMADMDDCTPEIETVIQMPPLWRF